jgi:hypothetical protein
MKYAQKFCGRVSACTLLSVLLGMLCFANGGSVFGQTPLSPATPSPPADASATQPSATPAPGAEAPAAPTPAAQSPAAQHPAAPTPAAQAPVVQPPVARAPAVPEQPLSADDVSWLFPAPTKESDLANLIAMSDLTVPNPQDPTKRDRVWSDATFQQFIAIAGSPTGAVSKSDKIGLPDAAKKIDAWHIAGVRFDPGAPGLSDAIIKEYGQSPQIRLIVQPVTREADGTVTAVDTTAHLIFSFAREELLPPSKPGCFPRPVPDLVAFKQIVAEVAALRSKLRDGQLGSNRIVTAGKALGVHPGLVDQTTASNVRAEMKAILERHLSPRRLGQMAIMALPPDDAPEPWIFLAMQFLPPQFLPPPVAAQMPNGGFVPVHNPTLDGKQFAQLLRPEGAKPRVVPEPHTNNLAPITCVNAAVPANGPPIPKRKGVATADLPTGIQKTAAGKAKVLSVLNTIADPNKSHFFNTDCVSCHTETRRALELLLPRDIPKIAAAPLPNGSWNVRNFGWSPLSEGDVGGTVSRRTTAETKAVVDFINAKLLK